MGRVQTYEAIVKGEDIQPPGVPESFKVLIKELQSLGLNVGDPQRERRGDPLRRGRLGLSAARPGRHQPRRVRGLSDEPAMRDGRDQRADRRRRPALAPLTPAAWRRRTMLEVNNFNAIRISLAVAGADPRLVQGRGDEAGDDQLPHAQARRRTASSTSASSAPRGTGSATAASTSASATRASSATSAASRSRAPRCAASGWATSSWPARSATSGTSRARPAGSASCSTSAPRNLERILYFALVHRDLGRRGGAQARAAQQLDEEAEGRGGAGGGASSELEDELRADLNRRRMS